MKHCIDGAIWYSMDEIGVDHRPLVARTKHLDPSIVRRPLLGSCNTATMASVENENGIAILNFGVMYEV
jgi:hypothetical protein